MPAERYKIAIVGSGPAGLSAAGRAAEMGISHVLLEATGEISNTIQRYQKRKFVMAEPGQIPLRSSVGFGAGSREQILSVWEEAVERLRINVRFGAEVKAIAGGRGDFSLSMVNGDTVQAERVILAIGLQGNLRRLGVPGENLDFVQYQLDDPDEYAGETIVVVGAGDAAIENALALAAQNSVIIVNRRDDFDKAKQANVAAIRRAIDGGQIQGMFNSSPTRVDDLGVQGANQKRGMLTLKNPEGQVAVNCDRVIARLGATPPRKFVESIGIEFPSNDPNAIPAVSGQYESNVPGIYIVGALAGCPLIKQAMNQGYEVVEYIEGRAVEPADEAILRDKLKIMPRFSSVGDALSLIGRFVPILSGLTSLQLREFMLDSDIVAPAPGETVFKYNDYSDTFFSILSGSVEIQVDRDDPKKRVSLRQGEFFGEMSLISGRRRAATVLAGEGCVLIETPRRSMTKLINSVASVKRMIDGAFLRRAIQAQFGQDLPAQYIGDLADNSRVESYESGAVILREGDPGDSLHLIRKGSVTVSRHIGGRDTVLSYIASGNYFGEMALLNDSPRVATIRASIATETIRIDGAAFKKVLKNAPELEKKLKHTAALKLQKAAAERVSGDQNAGDIISFLVNQGLGEATDVLLIDESLCVRCDNCERACAETHNGISRLDREAGPTYASIHVPTSCRHCEHPHCMKDCPPDAIHRAQNGEVFINDSCIGCGNCQRNCPYGVIHMAVKEPQRPLNMLSWLLFGKGRAPGEGASKEHHADAQKIATKCDMCKGLSGGSACVRACPTGAAIRVSPAEFINVLRNNPSRAR